MRGAADDNRANSGGVFGSQTSRPSEELDLQMASFPTASCDCLWGRGGQDSTDVQWTRWSE